MMQAIKNGHAPAIENGLGSYVPPNNIEAEQSTLGAMLIDRVAIDVVKGILQAGDYYRETHQLLHSVIVDLAAADKPVDLITVPEELRSRGKLDAIGGMSYLTSLFDTVPTAANVKHYAQIVMDKAVRRRMVLAAFETIGDARGDNDLTDIVAKYQERAYSLTATGREASKVLTLTDYRKRVYERASDACSAGGRPAGLMSGLTEYDKLLGGWKNGTFNLIAARPGMGKSVLAEHVSEHNTARHKEPKPGAYVTIEMSGEELALRSLSAATDIEAAKILDGKLHADDFQNLADAIERDYTAPLYLIDETVQTVSSIRSHCRRLNAEAARAGRPPLAFIVVDYIQILEPDTPNKDALNVAVGKFARGLKNLAREFDVPVIALAQLNRDVEKRQDKRPALSDLRDSGSLEAEADTVTFIYRAAYYDNLDPTATAKGHVVQETELIVPKHRGGRTGYCKVGFNPERTKFVNLAGMGTDEPTGF
jgi:replicative DNA helicase